MELAKWPGSKIGFALLLFLAAAVLDLNRRDLWNNEHDYYGPENDEEYYRTAADVDALDQQPANTTSQSPSSSFLPQLWPLAANEKKRSRPKYCRPKKHDPTDGSPYRNNTVAVLVERRDTEELLPIMMHYVGTLPGWNFHVFFSDQNRHRFINSPAVMRMIDAGQMHMTRIPDKYPLKNQASVSEFLTDTWFWSSIKEEHIMIFQLDAMICSNQNRNIDDYLHYDYIGGAFWNKHGLNYNGGLSLRRRSKILAVLAAHNLSAKSWTDDWEDQWFSRSLADMPGACLPSPRVAGEFSIDLMWLRGSLGGHQVWKWHPPTKLHEFEETCPELRLITFRKNKWRDHVPMWDGSI